MERAHQTLKTQIAKLRQGEFKYSSPHHVLHHVLFVINHLNVDTQGQTAMMRHWIPEGATTRPLVKWKNPLTGEWKGPDVLLTCGRGYACVFLQDFTSACVNTTVYGQHTPTRSLGHLLHLLRPLEQCGPLGGTEVSLLCAVIVSGMLSSLTS